MEILSGFIFLGSKMTADGACSQGIKRHFSLKEKLWPILKKQRHYFADKGPFSQSCGFSSSHVWMSKLDAKESWTLKKWCFWTGVLEKTLDSLLSSRRWNQSILKEISPEYSLEGLMLDLKLQYSGHLMWKPDSLEKTQMPEILIAGSQVDDRGWVGWMASPTWCTGVWASSRSYW